MKKLFDKISDRISDHVTKHDSIYPKLFLLISIPFIVVGSILSGAMHLVRFFLEHLCVSAFVVLGIYLILAGSIPLIREAWLFERIYPIDSYKVGEALAQTYVGTVLLRVGLKLPWI